MGGCEALSLGRVEPPVKYHPSHVETLTHPVGSREGTRSGGQSDWGGHLLKGNGGAQSSPQSRRYGTVSVRAEGGLTARPTGRAEGKPGPSDPAVPCGRAVAQRIKGTPGITGWSGPRVHIDGPVRHLDVGSAHPGGEEAPKGWSVRPLKGYVSWVQTVVRQVGPYPPRA